MARFTESQKLDFIRKRAKGYSFNRIARTTHNFAYSISKFIRKVEETGSIQDKPRSGRTAKITERDERTIYQRLLSGKSKSIDQLVFSYGLVSQVSDELQQSLFEWDSHKKGYSNDVTFIHDNCSSHTANIVKDYLKKKKMDFPKIPPHSPDINIIENLWYELKREVSIQLLNKPIKTKEELRNVIQDSYYNTIGKKKYLINNLYESLPARMQEIIKFKGSWTKY